MWPLSEAATLRRATLPDFPRNDAVPRFSAYWFSNRCATRRGLSARRAQAGQFSSSRCARARHKQTGSDYRSHFRLSKGLCETQQRRINRPFSDAMTSHRSRVSRERSAGGRFCQKPEIIWWAAAENVATTLAKISFVVDQRSIQRFTTFCAYCGVGEFRENPFHGFRVCMLHGYSRVM